MARTGVRVLVVDDHEEAAGTIASGLQLVGGFDVVGVAASVRGAGRLAESQPDVALVDVEVPEGGGASATREILAASPGTRILGHSSTLALDAVIDMLRAGASGYIAKGAPVTELAGALTATARGEKKVDSSIAGELVGELMDQLDRASRIERERAGKRARVKTALATDCLQVAYQPILDLYTGEIVGHEALSRFACEPRRTPDLWFAEAAEVGLGLDLELSAVRHACEHAGSLPRGTYLAVNVSPRAAVCPELVDILESAPVDDIVLEVTEHAPVADYSLFEEEIRAVRAIGARLAVDDAGAGFASLRHILELKAELIKLDASLTHDLDSDRGRRSLASALIDFAREMEVSILAEGIETAAQLEELRRLGVRYGQGFHLGRPRPAQDRVAAGAR
jgi:EAL domain-containing protein (putative c-di-GMP-specific phosphodiesterase class I)/DNA-binding NarL/FixJ family response regulator